MKISVYRKYRAAWLHGEINRNFLNVGIGNPNVHAWWAFTLYLFWR